MSDRRLTKPHYKSVIFASYLELLAQKYPHINVNDLVEKAGLSPGQMRDENHWVSVTFEKKIMDLIVERTGDPNIYYEAGRLGVSRTGLGEGLYFLAANIIPLDTIYRTLPKLTSLLNKVITVEVQESRNGYFKFLFKPKLDELDPDEAEVLISRMPFVMSNTKGYYETLPTLKNLPPAETAVELIDPKTGTYSLEVRYFANSRFLDQLPKVGTVVVFAASTWAAVHFGHLDLKASLTFSVAGVASLCCAYLWRKARKLRGIAVQTEQSLYRLDAQNKELYDAKTRLQRKLEESLATYELVSHLISASMEEEVLQLGCECLVNNLQYDRAFILLYDPEAKGLRLKAEKGLAPELRAGLERMTLPEEINDPDPAKFTNVFNRRQPLLVKNVREHLSKLQDPTSLMVLQASGSLSFVAAPIYTQNVSLGILVADCVTKQKIMTEDDLRLISTAAQQIAIGLEQQRSRQELVESYQKEAELAESYSRFVPFETLKLLDYKSIFDVKIGDFVEANVAILFTDIRGFTTLCETMSPEDILRFLNSYYARLSPLIKSRGGTIDKFMGDGVMAIFPNPEQALGAAVDIQRALFKYNLEHRVGMRAPIAVGVGIAAGRVVFGPLGSEKRLELTAIADTVNVASRLDGLCRDTGQNIMIAGFTLPMLKQFPQLEFHRLDPVKVKGRSGDVNVIAVSDTEFFSNLDLRELTSAQAAYLEASQREWESRLKSSRAA